MVEPRGAHQRSANQQNAYQNSGNMQDERQAQYDRQGSYQRDPYQRQSPQPQRGYDARQAQSRDDDYQRQAALEEAYRRRLAQQEAYRRSQGQEYGSYGDYGPRDMDMYTPKKRHPVRNTIICILVVLIIVGGFAGFTGYRLYNSAKAVKADAAVVMSDISGLKDQILAEKPDEANATASDIAQRAANMKKETSTWEWKVASIIPVYGSDIVKVRELSDVFDELANDAVVPLVKEVSQISLKNLLVDGSINVALAQKAVDAIDSAAPVITKSAAKLDAMGDAKLEQINGPLTKARSTLDKLNTVTEFVDGIAPSFSDMLGANGQRRAYLIAAQSNSEIRSTAGFIGSIGPLYLDNGAIQMGDFRTIKDIYPDENDENPPITDEERQIFGDHVAYSIADANFIPDFSRVSEIVKYAWENKGYGGVDGVIGCDPVFLQHMLAIAGPVTTSTGVVVDGSNAGQLLLHDVYYMDPELQDPFFEEVAALAFAQLMSNLGNVSLTDLAKAINEEIDSGRLRVWMAAENEEEAVETLNADGKMPHDPTTPTLGVYFDDESYSKLFWYMKADINVGDGVKNADGSTTYPVTVAYHHMLQPNQVNDLSEYMEAHNPKIRSKAEMICWVMLSAPEGGRISDFVLNEGDFFPAELAWRKPGDGSYITGTMTEASYQGLDFWYGLTRSLPGETFSINFNVTTSPQATEPLKVFRTPTGQEVAGW